MSKKDYLITVHKNLGMTNWKTVRTERFINKSNDYVQGYADALGIEYPEPKYTLIKTGV